MASVQHGRYAGLGYVGRPVVPPAAQLWAAALYRPGAAQRLVAGSVRRFMEPSAIYFPPDDVKAYLMGAFRNKIYKERLRTLRLPQPVELPFEGSPDLTDPTVEHLLILDETHQQNQRQIQRLLSSLPKRQQEIIYLHYYEGLEADQVAQVMDIGRQSVYNLLSRTLRQLRAAWIVNLTVVLTLLLS